MHHVLVSRPRSHPYKECPMKRRLCTRMVRTVTLAIGLATCFIAGGQVPNVKAQGGFERFPPVHRVPGGANATPAPVIVSPQLEASAEESPAPSASEGAEPTI